MSQSWRIAIVIGLVMSLVPMASAQSVTDARTDDCLSKINDQNAALSARDWSSLQTISRRYLRECKGVINADFESNAFQNIATANLFLGKPTEALSASRSCIDVSYSNVWCHVHEVNALLKLSRIAEARSAHKKTANLIPRRLESLRRELQRPLEPLDKELVLARIQELEVLQGLLNSFAQRLGD